jgi:hypothetical protein
MDDPIITCPQCKTEIKLTESLAAPLLESTKRQYEKRITDKDADVAKREAAVRGQEAALAKARESIDEQVAKRLQDARKTIVAEEEKKARALVASDLETRGKQLADLQEVLKERDGKLAEAQKAQAELIRKQRELDDAKREMDLTIEKRVQESLTTVRDKAKQEADEASKLKLMESQQTIASMQKQIEELKRKAEQGSQQLQGEVQELELEAILRAKFPHDDIDPVPKGEHGGDVVHRVIGPTQQVCGTILWEAKRTKNWSDHWLSKLRDDQRAAKAEFAVIVSQALPKHIEVFDHVDGIWITCPRAVIPVSIALRHSLIELALARQAGEGQQTKMELVYQYLTGPRFRQRIQALAEAFSAMQEDLSSEKKAIMKQWAKREQQIDRVMQATVGMYGDLQGIADKSLQEIEGLDIGALCAPATAAEVFPEMELREQAVLFQEQPG